MLADAVVQRPGFTLRGGTNEVLRGVSLQVARGEVVVVEDRLGVTMTEIIKTDRS